MFKSLFKKKSPQDRYRIADASNQKLRDKREKLDPLDEKNRMKINKKIHKNNIEIDIAKREMQQPRVDIDKSTKNINFNKINNSKQLNLHGHYHNDKKK